MSEKKLAPGQNGRKTTKIEDFNETAPKNIDELLPRKHRPQPNPFGLVAISPCLYNEY